MPTGIPGSGKAGKKTATATRGRKSATTATKGRRKTLVKGKTAVKRTARKAA